MPEGGVGASYYVSGSVLPHHMQVPYTNLAVCSLAVVTFCAVISIWMLLLYFAAECAQCSGVKWQYGSVWPCSQDC